jgi:5-methylcytosine-specific restriction endonuclease McrA
MDEGRRWRAVRAKVLRGSSTCWICGEPIAMRVPYPDPMSATVDHVKPRALGGPGLDPANLRPAHLGCNMRRGIGTSAKVQRRSREW